MLFTVLQLFTSEVYSFRIKVNLKKIEYFLFGLLVKEAVIWLNTIKTKNVINAKRPRFFIYIKVIINLLLHICMTVPLANTLAHNR